MIDFTNETVPFFGEYVAITAIAFIIPRSIQANMLASVGIVRPAFVFVCNKFGLNLLVEFRNNISQYLSFIIHSKLAKQWLTLKLNGEQSANL